MIWKACLGLFPNLLSGNYQVIVNHESCLPGNIGFSVPYFAGYSYTPYFDTLCNIKLVVKYGIDANDLPEKYSLVSGGVTVPETPPGGGNGV